MTIRSKIRHALNRRNVEKIERLIKRTPHLNHVPESLVWEKMDDEELIIELLNKDLIKFHSFEKVEILAPVSIVTLVKMKLFSE